MWGWFSWGWCEEVAIVSCPLSPPTFFMLWLIYVCTMWIILCLDVVASHDLVFNLSDQWTCQYHIVCFAYNFLIRLENICGKGRAHPACKLQPDKLGLVVSCRKCIGPIDKGFLLDWLETSFYSFCSRLVSCSTSLVWKLLESLYYNSKFQNLIKINLVLMIKYGQAEQFSMKSGGGRVSWTLNIIIVIITNNFGNWDQCLGTKFRQGKREVIELTNVRHFKFFWEKLKKLYKHLRNAITQWKFFFNFFF